VSQEGGNDGSDPIATFKGHGDVVGDVCWHASNPNMFASVGDDGKLLIWDSRQADATLRCSAHSGQINSVGFNPFSEHLIATAASDKTVALFDIRKIGVKVYSLLGHSSEVVQLSWSPHNEAVLASSATDRRVHIWDLSRIGQELSLEDSGDGAPELLFVHGGHTAKVSDFSWNPNDPWVMASVAEDNIVQVWQMCENIYLQEDDLPDAAAHELEGNAE
jgi:histone-binding protein RBBP4